MPRPYHSPSSIALAERCERAWYHAYVDGLRSPPTRATELGSAVHRVFEAYYRGLVPDWASEAGQIATSALHVLPAPHATGCAYYPEEALGGPWCGLDRVLLAPDGDATPLDASGLRSEAKPTRAIVVGGVRYAGFRDLLTSLTVREIERIGADHAASYGVLLVDHKTSSNPARYGKTAEQLVDDFAANLYVLDVVAWADRYGLALDAVPCRWPYISTGRKREVIPTDFTIEASRALEIVSSRTPLVQRIDAFQSHEDAHCNTSACADYGGCPYHTSKGGPCGAVRRVSALIMAHSKGPMNMAMSPELQAKFDALKNRSKVPQAAPPPPPPAVEDDAPIPEGEAEEPTAATAETVPPTPVDVPAPKRTRAPKASAVPATIPAPAPSVGSVDQASLVMCIQRYTEAQARVEEILAKSTGLAEAEASRDAALAGLREILA